MALQKYIFNPGINKEGTDTLLKAVGSILI